MVLSVSLISISLELSLTWRRRCFRVLISNLMNYFILWKELLSLYCNGSQGGSYVPWWCCWLLQVNKLDNSLTYIDESGETESNMKAMRWISGSFFAIGVNLLCFHIRLCNPVNGWCSRQRLWNAGSQLHCCHWGWQKDEGVSVQVCSSACAHQLCYNVSQPTPLALRSQCLPGRTPHLRAHLSWIWQARQQAAGLVRWPHCCSCHGCHPWHE